jgi:hypothetical protein
VRKVKKAAHGFKAMLTKLADFYEKHENHGKHH